MIFFINLSFCKGDNPLKSNFNVLAETNQRNKKIIPYEQRKGGKNALLKN